jgi:alpha-galactosidase
MPGTGHRFELILREDRIDVEAPALPQVCLRGAQPEVVYSSAGESYVWRPALRRVGPTLETTPNRHGLQMALSTETSDGALVIRSRLRNAGNEAVSLTTLAPLAMDASGTCQIGADARRWSVFRHGYQSWTGTRSFAANEVDPNPVSRLLQIGLIDIRHPSSERTGDFRSDLFTVIKNVRSGEALGCGFLTGSSAFGGIEVFIDGWRCARFAAALDYDGVVLEPGAEIEAPDLWLGVAASAAAGRSTADHTVLSSYASAAGAAMRARVAARSPVGWCSWYYYFTRVTEEDVLENLESLGTLRDRFPCDYVQVDDGYQTEIGDWLTANAKFPRGMGWLADQIRAAGFDAGIWTAPFIARRGSVLLRDHPGWFVRNRCGRPRFALYNPVWGRWGACYALDTTHPEVLDWLRATFRTISREWGYRVLKLDFLFAAALPGQRHDPRATRAMALRRGLEAIREGAGEDAFLLGCGCPFGPAVGIVDGMRIGPDVAPFWSNVASRGPQRDLHGLATKHAVRNILTRAVLHRRWWLNDPDCLMVRDTQTQLSADEVRSLATAIAVTDGMIVLSDRVEKLSAERLELLQRTLAAGGGTAEVLDAMHSDMPELVVNRAPERTLIAVFNFADTPRSRRLDLAAIGVAVDMRAEALERWSGDRLSVHRGQVDLGEIPAHGCRLLVVGQPAASQ